MSLTSDRSHLPTVQFREASGMVAGRQHAIAGQRFPRLLPYYGPAAGKPSAARPGHPAIRASSAPAGDRHAELWQARPFKELK
eukprot:CAMPEP_0181529292 /NCGR_PEP_ID=MMETSP1110-20121109/70980_1 /TAXON_ID=174948 /ORGANISM="Symbiodinium sp., Strain CCMP421" /LENGTH=82 /DNA_ID=CAMNT_0023660267 /DNA_START=76 /DNA_END=324 /DNA_ORIENTATION=+